jgi:hypothetical protein
LYIPKLSYEQKYIHKTSHLDYSILDLVSFKGGLRGEASRHGPAGPHSFNSSKESTVPFARVVNVSVAFLKLIAL